MVLPENSNVDNKLRMLNTVNEHIQQIVRMKKKEIKPFIDKVIDIVDCNVKFSVKAYQ